MVGKSVSSQSRMISVDSGVRSGGESDVEEQREAGPMRASRSLATSGDGMVAEVLNEVPSLLSDAQTVFWIFVMSPGSSSKVASATSSFSRKPRSLLLPSSR